jgi:CheY-like chemotaxis protein
MNGPYIVMLEYDEDDRFITAEHFAKTPYPVEMVSTADELLNFLDSCMTKKTSLPSLILMNYYSTDAKTLLQKLKGNIHYAHVPVIVLSGIRTPEAVRECYQYGASSFIQKPAFVNETAKKINTFLEYWFQTVELQ